MSPGRLRPQDGLRVASVGLRARPLRAALSALGIAIVVGALAGLLPAVRASRMPPAVALQTV